MRRQGWMVLLLAASIFLPGLGPRISNAVMLPEPALRDDLQIRRLLDAYITAENRRDLQAIRKLWPSMPTHAYFDRLDRSNDFLKSQRMTFQIRELEIDGTAATAQALIQDDVEMKQGGTQRYHFNALFALGKKDGEWRILAVQIAQL